MFLHNIHVCFILVLLYVSVSSANKKTTIETLRVTITPRRFRAFETPVILTLSDSANGQRQGNITRIIKIKILNQYKNVVTLNTSVRSFNHTILKVPCETFSHPGKYYVQYFVQGITKTFKELRQKVVVRGEKIRIDAPRNHTAVSGSVAVWITSNQERCKPFKGRVQLYWIKGVDDHVLVTTKKIGKVKSGKRIRVQFRCNIFDTEGIFYFKYISGYSNRTLARSDNMSVSWGKYQLDAQSKNIFPCSSSFAIKYTSPYCDKAEDKVEMRSKDFNNVIDSQTAYLGFRSVFFPCKAFKTHIRDYCFYYITKSSLTKTEKIQSKLCIPSFKTEPQFAGWSEWSPWGSCSSPAECGQGRKLRLRFCPPTSLFKNTKMKPRCSGPHVESTSCTLPPCQSTDCKSCSCVFTNPGGTIVSPESLPSFVIGNKSSCHWWIKINPNKKVKLWFDTTNLAANSAIHIIDGNDSNSQILERVTIGNQKMIGDIFGSSNIILIRYYFNGNLNETNSGFQLSYSSVDKSARYLGSTKSRSSTKRLAKMIFIGILALMVLIMAGIFYAVFFKMRRERREQKSETCLSQPASSFHTSTACMSESTVRSFYETQPSGDESVNNNSTFPRVNNNYRPRVSTPVRTDNRASVHVCPKCCQHTAERCSSEYVGNSHTAEWRRKLYNGSYYGPVVESVHIERERRGYSTIDPRRRTSSSSEEVLSMYL